LNDAAWVALLALTLVAFMLRAWHLDTQSLWRDEVDVARFAGWPLSQLVRSLTVARHNGPLYYGLMRGWLTLAGHSEFALRFPSLGFSVVVVPLTWQVGAQLVGRRAALLAALLVAISPYLVWYGQDAKMYALVSALTLLAITCLWKALATGRWQWWAGFVAAASLSLYVHMLAALLIPVYAVALPLAYPRFRSRWRGWLISLSLLIVPYVPMAAWQLPLVLRAHDTGHPSYPLKQIVSLLFNLYARGVAMVDGWVALAAFMFAILAGVVVTSVRTNGRPVRVKGFLVLWLFLPVGLVYLISLRAPVFEPRYLIYVAPAFYLLAALGIVGLARLTPVVGGALLALVLSFSLLGLATQAVTPIKSDFRAAAAYVMARHQNHEPIMFQMPYVRHTFDYYFDADYVALEGPWTNDDKSVESAASLMASSVGEHTDVWLVVSEEWLWDSRGLTRAWLNTHGRSVESARFALVDVYHYQLAGPH